MMSRLEIVIVTRKGAREVTHFLTIRDLAGFASDLLKLSRLRFDEIFGAGEFVRNKASL